MKLFRVTIKGLITTSIHESYVVADNSEAAYLAVEDEIQKRDWGFADERCLEKIELIAEDDNYTATKHRLFIIDAYIGSDNNS